jgi:Type IV secretory system Conjugative DNA transfer
MAQADVQDLVKRKQHNLTVHYPYSEGSLFLGYATQSTGKHREIGIKSKLHALTIAGSRSGKGAAVIIPNLLRWSQSALVIDPKGEAAYFTACERAAMGQSVHIIDPFNSLSIPPKDQPPRPQLQKFRAAFNPLATLDPSSPLVREDIKVITDGLMMNDGKDDGYWNDGGQDILNGIMAHLITACEPEYHTLPELRRLLTLPKSDFEELTEAMADNTACANLALAAAAKIQRGGKELNTFMSVCERNTSWLDSPPIKDVLNTSTFNLSDLKTKPTTVYLIIPAEYLGTQGRFLRLFVRSALYAMAKGGTHHAMECLFILDEFYSLGRIDEIVNAAGLMPGYGVKLWPFLQNKSQIASLYGMNGESTFFANNGVVQFFGNRDQETLNYISNQLGVKTIDEIGRAPSAPVVTGPGAGTQVVHSLMSGDRGQYRQSADIMVGGYSMLIQGAAQIDQANYQEKMIEYERQRATVGTPRIPPDAVARLVQLKDDIVADGQIVFLDGNEPYFLNLAPYFRPIPDDILIEADKDAAIIAMITWQEWLSAFLYPLWVYSIAQSFMGGFWALIPAGLTFWLYGAGVTDAHEKTYLEAREKAKLEKKQARDAAKAALALSSPSDPLEIPLTIKTTSEDFTPLNDR